MVLTGAAMTAQQRVENLYALGATVLVAEAEEALLLARTAADMGWAPGRSPLRAVLFPCQPGEDPAARGRELRAAWGVPAYAVAWLAEAGLVAFTCPAGELHLLETEHVAEAVDPAGGTPVPPGQEGELVLTPLGPRAVPLVRYRTGLRVALEPGPCPCGRTLYRLRGGILGWVGEAP